MRTTWFSIVAAAALLVAGCMTNPVTGRRELAIPDSYEIALGQQSAPDFEAEFGGKVGDPQLQGYVAEVGAKVAAVSGRPMPYEYTVLTSKVPNAFALPGGKVYITAGLLRLIENERQLAAVLGHETGHVAAKHNMSGLERQIGAQILVEIAKQAAGDKGATAGEIAQVVTGLANLRYSRDNEYEADMLGIRYMTAAGYSPSGMIELLNTLQTLDQSKPGLLTEMFQTHPLTQNRIERANEIVQLNHPGVRRDTPDANAARFQSMKALLK